MGDGQKSETTVEQPKWYQEAAKRNLRVADKAAQIGYVPYGGPDVAAFTQPQVQGMQGASNMAAAFGGGDFKKGPSIQSQLPKAQTFGDNSAGDPALSVGDPALKGYSSLGGYRNEMQRLGREMPGLLDYLKKFRVDPKTGKAAEFYGKPAMLDENQDPKRTSDNLTWQEYQETYGHRDGGQK